MIDVYGFGPCLGTLVETVKKGDLIVWSRYFIQEVLEVRLTDSYVVLLLLHDESGTTSKRRVKKGKLVFRLEV